MKKRRIPDGWRSVNLNDLIRRDPDRVVVMLAAAVKKLGGSIEMDISEFHGRTGELVARVSLDGQRLFLADEPDETN
jgi:hypothetical protein